MSYRVLDYMHQPLLTVDVGSSALAVSKLMAEKGTGYAVVLEKTRPIGMVTEKDLVIKVMSREKDPSNIRIADIMSTPLITVSTGATLEEAVNAMAEHRIRRLPVVKDNVIYGVFTSRDLTRHFSEYQDRITKDLINACALYPHSVALDF